MAKRAVQEPTKLKVNLSLDATLRRRLGAYAAWLGRDESDVVADALVEVLRGFVVHQRTPSVPSAEEVPRDDAPQLRAAG